MDRKTYLKLWREKNKEKIKEYNQTYFQDNKEVIYKKRNVNEIETGYKHLYNEQYTFCECKKKIKIKSLYNHRKICNIYKSLNV